jgi:hypothetical protein
MVGFNMKRRENVSEFINDEFRGQGICQKGCGANLIKQHRDDLF